MTELKKTTAFLLILVFTLLCFSSCFIVINHPDTSEETGDNIQTDSPETKKNEPIIVPDYIDRVGEAAKKSEERLKKLDLKKLGNVPVMITSICDTSVLSAESDGGEYTRALALRNKMLKDIVETDIVIQQRDRDTFLWEARNSIASEVYYTDLVFVPQNEIGYLARNNLLMNLNALFSNDFTTDYFNYEGIRQASGGYNTFAAMGSATLTGDELYCVYYNKDLANKLDILDLKLLVEEKEWTLDKINQYCNTAQAHDYIGIGTSSDIGSVCDSLFAAAGMNYVQAGYMTVPTVFDNGNKTDVFISLAKRLVSFIPKNYSSSQQENAFTAGSMLFFIDKLSKARELQNNFGILPLPLLDENQTDYYTLASSESPVFGVLYSNDNLEVTGVFLQAINAASLDLMAEGYAENMLNLYLRDSFSADVIGMLCKNPRYFSPYMFGDTVSYLDAATTEAFRSAVSEGNDYYALMASYRARADAQLKYMFGMD